MQKFSKWKYLPFTEIFEDYFAVKEISRTYVVKERLKKFINQTIKFVSRGC